MPSDGDTYTFGDGDVASRRLARLAGVYEEETRALIARAIVRPPALALDLGCGPGWTTLLVHRTSSAGRTIGVDISDRFVEEARRRPVAPGCDGVERGRDPRRQPAHLARAILLDR